METEVTSSVGIVIFLVIMGIVIFHDIISSVRIALLSLDIHFAELECGELLLSEEAWTKAYHEKDKLFMDLSEVLREEQIANFQNETE